MALLLAACANSRIESQVEAFTSGDAIRPGDRVAVVPAVEPARATLEHRTWVAAAQAEFRKRGFALASSPADADVVAVVGVAIDTGRDVTRSFAVPQFGVVGYGAANTFGTVNRVGTMATVNATTTYTPQYGVTGYVPGSRTERVFRRYAILGVFRRDRGTSQPVFESRVYSEGSCGLLSAVAPTLIEALFATFPAGGTRRVASEWNGNC
jgi:hypothetical protein